MASVTALFNSLKVQQDNEEHLQVYETSSKILETSFELSVLKTCLIALINLDRYELAFGILKKYPTPKTELVLEKSYIYYKLNKAELLSEILSQEIEDRGISHLKAQFYYQQGYNTKSLDLYKDLIKTSSDDEAADLSVNERAVIAQALMMDDEDAFEREPLSNGDVTSYDLLFNNSLIELNRGNLDKALSLLQQAQLQCEEAAATYQEDEKFTELFPILLQTSLVYFKIGNVAKSEEILTNLLQEINTHETDDKLTKLLILNNLYAVKLLDSKINSNLIYSNLEFPAVFKQVNLTIPQLIKLQTNERVLSLSNGKTNSKLFKLICEIDFEQEDERKIARKLFKLAMQNDDLKLNLLAIQYNNQIGNYDNSFLLINKLISEQVLISTPSLITIQVFIYEKLNKSVVELLTNFASLIDKYDLTNRSAYKIFKEISFKLLSLKQDKLSLEIATKLHQINADDKLISAIVQNDNTQLTPVEELISGIDTTELIQNGIDDELVNKNSTRSKSKYHKVTKSQYKRHKKIPEHLIGKTADAERWLPLKDRSYYKPKKGKKINATQGGTADNSTEMHISTTSVPSSAASNTSTKGKNQKKKGKKRH